MALAIETFAGPGKHPFPLAIMSATLDHLRLNVVILIHFLHFFVVQFIFDTCFYFMLAIANVNANDNRLLNTLID